MSKLFELNLKSGISLVHLEPIAVREAYVSLWESVTCPKENNGLYNEDHFTNDEARMALFFVASLDALRKRQETTPGFDVYWDFEVYLTDAAFQAYPDFLRNVALSDSEKEEKATKTAYGLSCLASINDLKCKISMRMVAFSKDDPPYTMIVTSEDFSAQSRVTFPTNGSEGKSFRRVARVLKLLKNGCKASVNAQLHERGLQYLSNHKLA